MLTSVIFRVSTILVETTLAFQCWIVISVTKDGSFRYVHSAVRRYNPDLRRIWSFYCLHRFTRSGHVNPYPPLPTNVCPWDSWFVGKQSWVEKNASEMVPRQRKGNRGEVTKYLQISLSQAFIPSSWEFPKKVIYNYSLTKTHCK